MTFPNIVVMSELEARALERGFCPKCDSLRLRLLVRWLGGQARQCRDCLRVWITPRGEA